MRYPASNKRAIIQFTVFYNSRAPASIPAYRLRGEIDDLPICAGDLYLHIINSWLFQAELIIR
jgi:hypothetical protein